MPAIFLALLAYSAAPAYDTVVVCPREMRGSLAPWIEHRTRQGHSIGLMDTSNSPEQVRRGIRDAARGKSLRYVVLVGDAPLVQRPAEANSRQVPTHYQKATVVSRFGSEPTIATDNWYADLDDDALPDVAIGRITADNPAELDLIVGKILDYERSADFGMWRRHVNFVAGLGGFGTLVDAAIEAGAKKLITDGVPGGYSTTLTYASLSSPYCPEPRDFSRTICQRLNEGCLFWVYMGHGGTRGLDWLSVPGGRYPVLAAEDMATLNCMSGAPIACLLSCYAGAFDASEDCLAEHMLRTRGAPVAVLCGSRVTMPYAMAVLGNELLDACFAQRKPTLGECLLVAKRRMAADTVTGRSMASENRRALDTLARLASPPPADLEAERREHLHLFNLIGDPCLRVRYGERVELAALAKPAAGDRLLVTGSSPLDGDATVEVVARRDRMTFKPPRRSAYDGSARAAEELNATYRRANDLRYGQQQWETKKGPFRVEVPLAPDASGPCHVRVFVRGASDFALGSRDLTIEPAPSATTAAR